MSIMWFICLVTVTGVSPAVMHVVTIPARIWVMVVPRFGGLSALMIEPTPRIARQRETSSIAVMLAVGWPTSMSGMY